MQIQVLFEVLVCLHEVKELFAQLVERVLPSRSMFVVRERRVGEQEEPLLVLRLEKHVAAGIACDEHRALRQVIKRTIARMQDVEPESVDVPIRIRQVVTADEATESVLAEA